MFRTRLKGKGSAFLLFEGPYDFRKLVFRVGDTA
jgi:hypothetical protein